jgi:hypothetical protein
MCSCWRNGVSWHDNACGEVLDVLQRASPRPWALSLVKSHIEKMPVTDIKYEHITSITHGLSTGGPTAQCVLSATVPKLYGAPHPCDTRPNERALYTAWLLVTNRA